MQNKVQQAFANVDTPASLVVKTVTTGYLVSVDDDVILCDPSRASFVVTLPKLGTLTKPVSIRVLPGLSTANLVTVKAPNPTTIDAGPVVNLSTIPLRLVSNQQGYWSA